MTKQLKNQLADKDLQAALRRSRKLPYFQQSVRRSELPSQLEEGWYPLKEFKASVRLAKNKTPGEILEDELWTLFADMGFKYLSAERDFVLVHGDQPREQRRASILAVDDECALVVVCKSSEGEPKRATFGDLIEAIGREKAAIIRTIRTAFDKPKLKVGFVLASKGYQFGQGDADRMSGFAMRHLSDRDIDYYRDLAKHLGEAARYQFHADLFAGQDIPELDNRVPAVEGRMGGHTYYSFSAAPAMLLKLGFVLHRTKSVRLTPSYQRLIKKSRLTNIQLFVENGGFFPNSLLVNIETGGKRLQFDRAPNQSDSTVAKLGVLHLPPRYRSIYVIDGQHRLYAYSGSHYAKTNSLPVVAFVDLDRREQLRLFMEINENQKAVNRNLKNTLDADLKWDSANLKDRAEGIKKQLALDLGDEVQSPLFGRIQVGEDEKTETRNITLEAILKGINRTSFIGKFRKNTIVQIGHFYDGSSERTLQRVRDFLFSCFSYSQDRLPDEWRKRPEEGALLPINVGVTAYIWLLNDIISYLTSKGIVDPIKDSPASLLGEMRYLLEGFVEYIRSLSFEERAALRSKYGAGADTRLWRCLQKGVSEYRPEFSPTGMSEYWRDQSKQFNMDTYEKIGELERFLKEEVREELERHFGSQWLKKGIPAPLFEKLHADAAKKNREVESDAEEKEPWDCMYIVNYRDVISYGSNWSNLFQKRFTIPGQERLKKDERSGWLVRLNTIRNKNAHDYSVSEDEYRFVAAIHNWLLNDDPDDIKSILASAPDSSATAD